MKKIILTFSVIVAMVLVATIMILQGALASPQAFAQTEATVEVPFLEEWQTSPHNDAKAEAFVHWNEESPAVVPTNCAKCHSTPGYIDFLGADGSAAGTVEKEVPVGTTIACVACHNQATLVKTSVVMPSGLEITNLGDESRCMECHQGRASKVQVDQSIEKAGLTDMDTVSADLGFTNIHYFAAAATKYGTLAKGGYEYEGKSYDGNFNHVEAFNTCIECHDSHTLQVKVEECQGCHEGVTTAEDARKIRMPGSLVDYDGDGNVKEGIADEITGLQEKLYQAMQAYGNEKTKTAIAYNAATHPYFFIDTNKDGKADETEANGDNAYNAWTGRLAKAAYNYQVSIKDPGAYVHGGKYIIELLTDSIEDLNSVLSKKVDVAQIHRIDRGHFAGSEEAFRHWDEEGMVEADCVKCHTAEGLPMFLQNEATVSVPPSNGLECSTCHSDLTTFTLREVTEVKFPSGATVGFEDASSNLCIECHQGRESTVSVNNTIKDLDDDATSDKLRFLNVHYFAAGATLFGTEVKGAYEYDGKTYRGQFKHVEAFDTCAECHDAHALSVQVEGCGGCHDGVKTEEDLRTIRMAKDDFDGDGDTKEGIAGEIDTMREALYTAMQAYAKNTAKTAIAYNPSSYPYYFIDTNGNGKADPDEANSKNAFNAWTPRLLRAAYNYQYSTKDPGTFAHNGQYIIQVLYDSLEDVGADTGKMVRPK